MALQNQHVNGATDCCIFQSTALFEFAMHYTKQTTIKKQIYVDFKKIVSNSGELRNGSSLHAGFYDLTLFFPVSSFILILDRCV